jgi:peptide methionine sulfoxide reductase msrA/msrB
MKKIFRKRLSASCLLAMTWVLGFINALGQNHMQKKPMTAEEKRVIVDKGTERPFTGLYWNSHEKGTYACKHCGARLYKSDDKFDSSCGWPNFDDEIEGAVKRVPDRDGVRTEIVCASCGAHLGHVFTGEGFTPKNTRHCVNSISMNFIPAEKTAGTDTAMFAGGCFWGVEYHFSREPGVLSVVSGYTGGRIKNPAYEQVCSGRTGHLEAVKVAFDPAKTSYENLVGLFFEIHDFSQENGQGPDIGEQYKSAVFYRNENQKKAAEKIVNFLKKKGYRVATQLLPAKPFYKAEAYHQDYYAKNGKQPYCHIRKKLF